LPFLASAILVGVGLWVRLRIGETPSFQKVLTDEAPSHVPMAEVFKRHPGALLGGTFAAVACFAIFYLSTAFALGYGTTTLGYSRETFLQVQLGAIVFLAAGIIAAGYAADASSARRVLMAGCLGTLAVGAAMAAMMGSGCLSWGSSTDHWARFCPACSRRGCATPAPRWCSTWAASSAGASLR
jgi:hypothetical protein